MILWVEPYIYILYLIFLISRRETYIQPLVAQLVSISLCIRSLEIESSLFQYWLYKSTVPSPPRQEKLLQTTWKYQTLSVLLLSFGVQIGFLILPLAPKLVRSSISIKCIKSNPPSIVYSRNLFGVSCLSCNIIG